MFSHNRFTLLQKESERKGEREEGKEGGVETERKGERGGQRTERRGMEGGEKRERV